MRIFSNTWEKAVIFPLEATFALKLCRQIANSSILSPQEASVTEKLIIRLQAAMDEIATWNWETAKK